MSGVHGICRAVTSRTSPPTGTRGRRGSTGSLNEVPTRADDRHRDPGGREAVLTRYASAACLRSRNGVVECLAPARSLSRACHRAPAHAQNEPSSQAAGTRCNRSQRSVIPTLPASAYSAGRSQDCSRCGKSNSRTSRRNRRRSCSPSPKSSRSRTPARMRKQELMFAHPEAARRQRGRDHRRRRRRGAAGRLRLPALARRQLPRRAGRHLCLALADPALRPAHRRYGRGPDPQPQGRRALFRAAEGQHDQFRGSGQDAAQGPFRQPDAALSGRAPEARDRGSDPQGFLGARHRYRVADRQGPARADRRAAAHRQDGAAAEHRPVDHRPTTRNAT